jgi:hypothetical protein
VWVNPSGLTVSGVGSRKDPGYGEGVARWAWWVTPGREQKLAGWAEPGLKLGFGLFVSEKIVSIFFQNSLQIANPFDSNLNLNITQPLHVK